MLKRRFLPAALLSAGLLFAITTARSQGKAAPEKQKPNVAILIFDGVQIIDYTGPYEVLGSWGRRNVFTVAEKGDPITTHMGMRVIPNYTFADSPPADIIVIPGGGSSVAGPKSLGVGAQLDNANVMQWIRTNAAQAKYVLSVCNGAFLLARAGLLDGLEATTTAGQTAALQRLAPKTKVIADRRFVDNGKVITTAGLSSGIDGALHVIEKVDGTGWAQMVAINLEYNWQPQSGYARSLLADMKLPPAIYSHIFPRGTPLSMSGGKQAWEERWQVPLAADESPLTLLKNINESWATDKDWVNAGVGSSSTGPSLWQFKDEHGKGWMATVNAEAIPGQTAALVTLRIVSAELLSDLRSQTPDSARK
jgi:putative intracellular protease/amidase